MSDISKLAYVIFSIDFEALPQRRAAFENAFENSPITKTNLIQLLGSYKGVTEASYLCRVADYEAFVRPQGYVANQESILRVSECNKRYATLEYIADGKQEFLGSLKDVSETEAKKHDAWTYRADLDVYWIAVKGNPDSELKGETSSEKLARVKAELDTICDPSTNPHIAIENARELLKSL